MKINIGKTKIMEFNETEKIIVIAKERKIQQV